MSRPDGTIGHAEVRIGDSTIMISDAEGVSRPMPSAIDLSVTDSDAVYKRALRAGATSLMAPVDHLHGGVRDPVGNVWWIATHTQDVSREEMTSRAAAQMK
jgi:PhnB protein